MNDLEQIRDALESAKTFLGQDILWKESNYVRGHGEKKYSELCVALSIIDRMIETPAPQGWSAIETAPKNDYIVVTDGGFIAQAFWSGRGWMMGFCEGNIKVKVDLQPTHWMPLPEAPRAEQKGQNHE